MTDLANGFEQLGNGVTATAGAAGNTGGSGSYFDEVSRVTGGTLAGSTAQAAHGSTSLQVAVGSTAGACYAGWAAQIGTVTTSYGRIYLRLSASPGTDDAYVTFYDNTTTWAGAIQVTASRTLRIQTAAYGFAYTFTSVIPVNTWVRVEWQLISGTGTSGSCTVRYYASADSASVTETGASGGANFGANLSRIRLGWTGSHANQPASYIDDAGFSTAGWLGPAAQATPATVVQAKRVTGSHSVILDAPTTAANTLYVAYAGTSAGSGTPAVTGITLGGSADNFAAQVSQAQGSQSYAVSAVWQDPNCAGGQTDIAVTGTNLVAADALVYVVEVAGLGPAPALEKSSAGPTGAGTTTWTSGQSGVTAAGGGFVLGVTAHGPDRSGDSLTGPGSPWVNCAQFQWSGGAAIAGYQAPAAAGSYAYSGTSSTSDYYTSAVACFAPSAGTYATPAAADGSGDAPGPVLSLSQPAAAAVSSGSGDAPGAAPSTGITITPAAAIGSGGADAAAPVTPAAGAGVASSADGGGTADGPAVTGTATAYPAQADGSGGALAGGTAGSVITPAGNAAAAGAAYTAAAAVTATAFPDAAAGAGGAVTGGTYTLSMGQAPAQVAAGSGDIPAVTIFAYAQPVYLGASGGTGRPLPLPGGSQVAVAAPDGTGWTYLGSLGHVQDLAYSFVMPGGADKLTCTLKLPASLRSGVLSPGWRVRVTRGGHVVWTGRLDEPQPGPDGWQVTAAGDGQRGQDFAAVYSGTWPSGQPDDCVNQAIGRGLSWVNPGVGQPAWAWYGQQPDPGSLTVAGLLDQLCGKGGGTWYVDSQPGGAYAGADLKLLPIPATVNRLLLVTTPVPRTLAALVNRLVIRYQTQADNTDTGTVAAYAVTTVTTSGDVTVHGATESYADLSSAGVMSAGAAQAAGAAILAAYARASYAGPFAASSGQLLTANGVPVDPGTDQAGTVCRLVIADFGYGGEVTPATPVTFPVGAYEWDDQHGIATITPFQSASHDLAGLVSARTGGA